MPTSSYDPMQAYNYGVFVENAYRMFLTNPADLTPPVLPDIFPSTWDVVLYLTAIDHIGGEAEQKFFGFVARSRQSRECIAAIRGTERLIEWLIDAEFLPTPFTPVPAAGEVEYGFFSIYQTMRGILPNGQQADVRDFLRGEAAGGKVTIVGHSLGSALAAMLALDVTANGYVGAPALYTLAAPRVGGEAFRTCFNQYVPQSYRVYNEPDLVPRLPPLYQQVDTGEEIDSKAFPAVKHSIACYHELVTYLYALNQHSVFPLGTCGRS